MPLFFYDFTKITLIYRRVIRNLIYVRVTNASCMDGEAGELSWPFWANGAALLRFPRCVSRRVPCKMSPLGAGWCQGDMNAAPCTFKRRSPAWPVWCGFLVCQAGGIFSFSQFSWKQRAPYPAGAPGADISPFPAGSGSAVRVLPATCKEASQRAQNLTFFSKKWHWAGFAPAISSRSYRTCDRDCFWAGDSHG